MEGKAVLFSASPTSTSSILELDTHDTEEFINAVRIMEPTFGGINLEDIAAPECFVIEERLKAVMKIPSSTTTSTAGHHLRRPLKNALEVAARTSGDVKIVISGAGAPPWPAFALHQDGIAQRERDPHRQQGRIYKGARST